MLHPERPSNRSRSSRNADSHHRAARLAKLHPLPANVCRLSSASSGRASSKKNERPERVGHVCETQRNPLPGRRAHSRARAQIKTFGMHAQR